MIKYQTGMIKFHFLVQPFHFKERNRLKAYVIQLLKKNRKSVGNINYVFCTDEYLHGLNKKYLRHNTYTDIITFELSLKEEPVVADIFISIDRVKENAILYAVPFYQEFHRLVFHGALHLCGFKDKSKADSTIMRIMENRCLKEYRVSREMVVNKH